MQINDNSNLTHALNHMPHQTGVWFSYTGFRFKDYYDVELHDGTILKKTYPNSTSFMCMDGSGKQCTDEDVAFLRLVTDSELEEGLEHTGDERIERNTEMFSDLIERDNPSGAPFICAKPDLTKVRETAEIIRKEVIEKQYTRDDNAHYVEESVMKALYGEGYFNWLNKYVK